MLLCLQIWAAGMGSAVVQDKYDKGCYYVDGQTWQVGRPRMSYGRVDSSASTAAVDFAALACRVSEMLYMVF
jgi:hypothetical protein